MRESFQMRAGDIEVGMMLSWRNEGAIWAQKMELAQCTKMIKLFILKVDSHISHCWVSKMLLCWDGKPKTQLSLTFSLVHTYIHLV